MLKAELHAHTSDDPLDVIRYDPLQLIDRAAALRYDVLAITLHNRQFDVSSLVPYARARGVVLINGIERTVSGKHVLLLNFPAAAAERFESFEDIRRAKQCSDGIVIAPHPFFPSRSCLRGDLDRNADVFDAVEINAFYTSWFDFNRQAAAWASAHRKPLVGAGDVHRLFQLGTTYTLIDAPHDVNAICAAIREGRVRVRTQRMPFIRAVRLIGGLTLAKVRPTCVSRKCAHHPY